MFLPLGARYGPGVACDPARLCHAPNPLDLTGIVFGQPAIYGAALAALAEDPSIGAIAAVQDVPSGLDQAGAAEYEGIGDAIATFAGSAAIPCIVLSNLPRVHADFEHALEVADVPVLLGTRAGLLALKALLTPPQIAATPLPPRFPRFLTGSRGLGQAS